VMILILPIFLLAGYLIGSIPFGLILTKLFTKQDIREIGSGNIGATNVLRTGNKKLAIATLLLDAGKGAVLILPLIGNHDPAVPDFFWNMVGLSIGLGVVLGHCFPIWLKFKGGKGVATSLGVLLAAVPYAGLAAVIAWIIAAFAFRLSSLAALIAALVAPIVTFFIYGQEPAAIASLITLLIWARHKENMERIIAGTEPRIGKNKEEGKS